jgi:hypothetical protein
VEEQVADSPISARSLARQVARAGKRWNLVPDMGHEDRRLLAEALLEAQGGSVKMMGPDGREWTFQIDMEATSAALEHEIANPKVGVAEVVHQAEARNGIGSIRKTGKWRLCSVSDEHPFSAVLGNRVKNGETDLAAPYKQARQEEKQRQARIREERRREAKRIWRDRKKIVALPTGIVPAGLVERARRNRG